MTKKEQENSLPTENRQIILKQKGASKETNNTRLRRRDKIDQVTVRNILREYEGVSALIEGRLRCVNGVERSMCVGCVTPIRSWPYKTDIKSQDIIGRPLPNIQLILDTLGGAKWFSMDPKSGFFRTKIEQFSKRYTAIIVKSGQYQYNYMSFENRKNSSAFTRAIQSVFQDLNGKILVF